MRGETGTERAIAEKCLLLAGLMTSLLVSGSTTRVEANGCCILWVRPVGLEGTRDGAVYAIFDSDGLKQYVLGYDEKNGLPFSPKGYSVKVHVWTSRGLYEAAFMISPDHHSLTNSSVTVPFRLLMNATAISCG